MGFARRLLGLLWGCVILGLVVRVLGFSSYTFGFESGRFGCVLIFGCDIWVGCLLVVLCCVFWFSKFCGV